MAATGTARIQVTLDPLSPGATTDELLAAILHANPRVSDLIFSPGKNFQLQINGEFVSVEMPGMAVLTADDTRRVAADLIGSNKPTISMLREQGYCDISYALPGVARFRVNIFIQRGSCAVVMRVIPTAVPDFEGLHLPDQHQSTPRRFGADHRTAGFRQVFDSGSAARLHQRNPDLPHYNH
jgi:Tfp pilus assembly pilus retraction ATPase PilT